MTKKTKKAEYPEWWPKTVGEAQAIFAQAQASGRIYSLADHNGRVIHIGPGGFSNERGGDYGGEKTWAVWDRFDPFGDRVVLGDYLDECEAVLIVARGGS